MRIRKGGKFSAEIASQCMENQSSQAYVCEVNRSPWDVIPFFSQEHINSSLNFQSEGKLCSNEIEGFATIESDIKRSPVEAKEDVICLGSTTTANKDKIIEPEEFSLNIPVTNDELPPPYPSKDNNKRILFGRRRDGMRWDYSRRRTARNPNETRISDGEADRVLMMKNAACDHVSDGSPAVESTSANAGGGTSSRRAKAAKRAIKDDTYYYYSGYEFESMWRKIRGGGERERSKGDKGVAVQSSGAAGNIPVIYDVSSDSD